MNSINSIPGRSLNQIVPECMSSSWTVCLCRVQEELLARLWAGQSEKRTVDPIETGSRGSCSTCVWEGKEQTQEQGAWGGGGGGSWRHL